MDEKDLLDLSTDELLEKEKQIRRNETIARFIIGFLAGVLIYGVATKGFGFLHIFLPILIAFWIIRNSQNQQKKLKAILNELSEGASDT